MKHNRRTAPLRLLWGALVIVAVTAPSDLQAQTAQGEAEAELDPSRSGALYEALARMDSLLFDASFVSCDPEIANSIFADDVEFYHDQTGFQSSEQARENTRRLTDSCPAKQGITRTVVEGSLRVYPIRDYGAVQTGLHRFDERSVSTSTVARFVHLWHRQGEGWRLARVLSFDHDSGSAGAGPEGDD